MKEKEENLKPTEDASSDRMPSSQCRENLVRAKSEGHIDEEGEEAIYWLFNYWCENKNLSLNGLSAAMKKKLTTAAIHGLFHGTYPAASWSGPVKNILAFKKVVEEESKKKDIGFVMTSIAKQIFLVCDAAANDGMPAFIYGPSQLGKTTALKHYQELHNHGKTKYIRMGSGWTKGRFVRELAISCKCYSKGLTIGELESSIFGSLNRFNLLLVDEFHLAIETTTENHCKAILEFIREVYDRTQCGLVMASTKVGEQGLEHGRNAMLFDQLRRRGVVKYVLPDVPPVKDINTIAKSFELEVPQGELLAGLKLLLKTRGIGVYIKYLQKAHAVSIEKKVEFSWDLFTAVQNLYTSLASPEKADY